MWANCGRLARGGLALTKKSRHGWELERLAREKPELMKITWHLGDADRSPRCCPSLVIIPSGSNSEACLGKLCGVCPIPAFQRKTNRMRAEQMAGKPPGG